MAHKKNKGGSGPHRYRTRNGRQYPRSLQRCVADVAPGCKKWFNPNSAKAPDHCNPCWQKITSKGID